MYGKILGFRLPLSGSGQGNSISAYFFGASLGFKSCQWDALVLGPRGRWISPSGVAVSWWRPLNDRHFEGFQKQKLEKPAPSKSKRSQMLEVPKREIEEPLTDQKVSRPRGLDCQASGQSPAQSRQTPRPLRSPHAALAPPRRSLPRGSTPTRTV